jgi:4'-phosphopantetheinyl transferase
MDSIDWLWAAPTSSGGLTEDHVLVWSFALDLPSDKASAMTALLSPEERERAGKFGSEELRDRFIAGRATLRQFLARLLECDGQGLTFRYGEHGKPELDGPQAGRLHFNLSHTGAAALLAVAKRGPVGVDLEKVRPVWNPQQIASRFFTENEGRKLDTVSDADRSETFFRLWTRKEAWLKATGEGIATALDRVEVSFLPDEPAQVLNVVTEHGQAGDWTLAGLQPARGYVGALAIRGQNLNIHCRHWSNAEK